jgi:hypothetical protein
MDLSSGPPLNSIYSSDCDSQLLGKIAVIAHTPWNQLIRGTWTDASHLVFHVDWSATGLDPLADDATGIVARPWSISGTVWTPSTSEASAILKLVGDATQTEIELVRGGAAPKLEVTGFSVEGDLLHLGGASWLVVRIANRGAGAAYRVVATTRSSIDALQNRRLPFGRIPPGTDKVRRLKVIVPLSETAPDTMLVLMVSEGNGVAPANVNRRITISPLVDAPVLAIRCAVVGHETPRPDLDAGQHVTLRCTVDNTGEGAAKQVDIAVAIAGGTLVRSPAQVVPRSDHATFEVPVIVPRELPIDAPVKIEIEARDHASSQTARVAIVGVVRKLKLCVVGQLTREQYRAKLAELRAAVAAGDLTQAQFDRYDAELVACTK